MPGNGDRGSHGSGVAGRLRVCAPVTFARLHIVPKLPDFMAAHLGLTLDMVSNDGVLDLADAGIDIVLYEEHLPDSAHTAKKIGKCQRVVVGAPSYFARVGEPLSPDDLTNCEAIIHEGIVGGVNWKFWRGSIATHITLKGRLYVTAAEGVREAVLAGLGFAVAPEWLFAPELAIGTVRTVLQDWSLPTVNLWAVFPKRRQTNPVAYALADFIEAQLAKS
jgi:DNA-binding transcriptional LysR family regulator